VVSFVSLAAAVGFLVQDALTDTGPSTWTGIAGVLQTVFVLIRYLPLLICGLVSLPHYLLSFSCNIGDIRCSGLIYWTCRSED
jgi:hypothetical protein